MLEKNILRLTDGYKYSHWAMYPPNTTRVYSYLESRGGVYPQVTFYGLQYILKKYLAGVVLTQAMIDEMDDLGEEYFGNRRTFNKAGCQRLLEKWKGKLPLKICALPEGTTIPVSNALITADSTDPEFPWLTNMFETLLVQAWYPITVCTQSRAIKKVLTEFANQTGDPSWVSYKLHDFGFRGTSSVESAGIGGSAHLVNFVGTDTMEAVFVARQYYDAPRGVGQSIPAGEHSTITSWGAENEIEAFKNALDKFPEGYLALPIDSTDSYHMCKNGLGGVLQSAIRSRNGTFVARPDSGVPWEIVPDLMKILEQRFGCQENDKGYKVLPRCIRMIQGDGVDIDSIKKILHVLRSNGYSSDNIAFGMGGALLQRLDRDTNKFAFKCSYIERDGKGQAVSKKPVTDSSKNSKAGLLSVIREGDSYRTASVMDEKNPLMEASQLRCVFFNGDLPVDQKFADIRVLAKV